MVAVPVLSSRLAPPTACLIKSLAFPVLAPLILPGVFTDVDAGVTPDYQLDSSYFYNDAKLASFVESL